MELQRRGCSFNLNPQEESDAVITNVLYFVCGLLLCTALIIAAVNYPNFGTIIFPIAAIVATIGLFYRYISKVDEALLQRALRAGLFQIFIGTVVLFGAVLLFSVVGALIVAATGVIYAICRWIFGN